MPTNDTADIEPNSRVCAYHPASLNGARTLPDRVPIRVKKPSTFLPKLLRVCLRPPHHRQRHVDANSFSFGTHFLCGTKRVDATVPYTAWFGGDSPQTVAERSSPSAF